MNRALPPGDRGNRSAAPGRASGRGRAVPGAGGLVGGTAAAGASDGWPLLRHIWPTFARTARVGVPAKVTVSELGP